MENVRRENYDAHLNGNGDLVYFDPVPVDEDEKGDEDEGAEEGAEDEEEDGAEEEERAVRSVLMKGAYFEVLGIVRTFGDDEHSYSCQAKNRDGIIKKFVFEDGLGQDEIARRLRSGGVRVEDEKNVKELIRRYIQFGGPGKDRFADKTGWQNNEFKKFALPDRSFSVDSDGEGIIWRGDTKHFYAVKGTLEQWCKLVSRKCIGNYHLIIAILTAFAAAFLRPTGTEGFVALTYGDPKDGKTTQDIVGGSVCGGGGKHGFCRSFATTSNAFAVQMGLMHNDMYLGMEEMGQITDRKELFCLAYNSINGVVRSRLNDPTSGESFTIFGMANGEKSFPNQLRSLGGTPMAGQEARIISIPSRAGNNKDMGIFQDFHEIELLPLTTKQKKQRLAGELHHACKNVCYGSALRAFLEVVAGPNFQKYVEFVKHHQREFVERYLPANASVVVNHVIEGFALKYAVGQLPVVLEITNWPADEPEKAVAWVWNEWLKTQEPDATSTMNEGIQSFKMFCRAHLEYRETRTIDGETVEVFVFVYEKKNNVDDFRYLACAGYNHHAIATELKERKVLLTDRDRPSGLKRKMDIPGTAASKNCYVILASFIDAD